MIRRLFDINALLFDVVALVVSLALASGCSSSHSEESAPRPETVFKSPDAAVDAFVAALRPHDVAQLRKIFGPAGDEIVSSGDPVADRMQVAKFLAAYDQ